MGRGKVEVKRIEDKSNRQVTFSKRRTGLMKKARELSVLCDVDVAVHIFSGRGRLYEFTSGESLRKIFERFEGQRRAAEADSKSAHDPHEAKLGLGVEYRDMWTISDHLEMVQRQLEGLKVEPLNMEELTQIEHQLDALLQQTRIKKADQEPIKYSDIPRDVAMMQSAENMLLGQTQKGGPTAIVQSSDVPCVAAMMQSAENMLLGQTQKGGPAAIVQSAAATMNERACLLFAHDQIPDNQGLSLAETNLPSRLIITESVGGQVVEQYVQCKPLADMEELGIEVQQASMTIGEALEATAQTAGYKPIDRSDAAAIQAAEVRAAGTNVITPGGLAATAQSAATHNMGMTRDADKVKLAAVLMNATMKLSADKAVTWQDAERVIIAELRNNPSLTTHPGGVADSVAAAARLNERTS